jgi:NAD+ kinase
LKVGLVSRTDNPDALDVSRKIAETLTKLGVEVTVETDTSLALRLEDESVDISDLDGDFIVNVGGDGTILRTAMNMKNPETPILGVNMGRRGFLSTVIPGETEWALNRVLNGDYFIEESIKVRSRCLHLDDSFPDALNEVLVASSLPSKMLLMELRVDEEKVAEIQADGALVSTPAGSTAYNMSAGGSILTPKLEAFVLTAVCPYSYFKSLVVPSDSKISIEMLKPKADGMVIIDGRSYIALRPGSTVECFLSPYKTRFIRFKSFYSRIQRRIIPA